MLLLRTTWIDLKDILLSEVYQIEKNNVCFHLYVESKQMKQYECIWVYKQYECGEHTSGSTSGERWGRRDKIS